MKIKKLTRTAILIALLLVVQILKNVSGFISGPVINVILLVATFGIGPWEGILLSVIAPVSSYFIAPASPMSMMTMQTHFATIPVVITGNVLIILLAYCTAKKKEKLLWLGLLSGTLAKWAFMALSGKFILAPMLTDIAPKLANAVPKIFSVLQIYSAAVGCVIFLLLWIPLKKVLKK